MVKIFQVHNIAGQAEFSICGTNSVDALERAKESGFLPSGFTLAQWERLPKRQTTQQCLDDFLARYEPCKNHLDSSAGFDGTLFETFGEQDSFVRAAPVEKVWTVVEGEDFLWLLAGFRFVNRFAHIITRAKWDRSDECYIYD